MTKSLQDEWLSAIYNIQRLSMGRVSNVLCAVCSVSHVSCSLGMDVSLVVHHRIPPMQPSRSRLCAVCRSAALLQFQSLDGLLRLLGVLEQTSCVQCVVCHAGLVA